MASIATGASLTAVILLESTSFRKRCTYSNKNTHGKKEEWPHRDGELNCIEIME